MEESLIVVVSSCKLQKYRSVRFELSVALVTAIIEAPKTDNRKLFIILVWWIFFCLFFYVGKLESKRILIKYFAQFASLCEI